MKKLIISTLVVFLSVVIIASIFNRVASLGSGNDYLPDKELVKKLEDLEIVEEVDIKIFGGGWAEVLGENTILHLSGTPYEMGYQHGKLLRDEILSGVYPIFSDPISHNSDFYNKPKWMRKLMLKFLEIKIYKKIEKNTPGEYLEELKGIADGAGTDYRSVFIANFLSDLTMAMVPSVIDKKASDMGISAACSSFAASGPATAGGKLIFGRNTDYSGQGRWGPNQVIFFYEPKDGYRYVKVSTAGLIKCNSAMNEMGIVLGGHFMGFEGSAPDGLSFTIFENEIMRKAQNIDDAFDILKGNSRGGSFGFLIADGKTKEAVVVESNPELLGIREMGKNMIALTNFATTPELESFDLMMRYDIAMRNLLGRYTRLIDLIEDNYGKITPALAAELMSDHWDVILDIERGTGISVCSDNNVTSVVFVPEDGFFWVATGKEPACAGEYIGFDLKAGFEGKAPRVSPKNLSGYRWKDNSRKDGLYKYMEAYLVYEEDFDNKNEAIEYLKSAIEVDPTEPIYYRMAARLLIHEGQYREAEGFLLDSLEFPQSKNETAQTYLLLGQAYDILGERDEALSMYHEIFELKENEGEDYFTSINDMLFGLAVGYGDHPFLEKDIGDILIGFSLETGLE